MLVQELLLLKPFSMKTKITFLLSFLFYFNISNAQLTIQTGLNDTTLTTLLEGLGVSITNLTKSCDPTSYGEFNGTSELSIDHGMVLSTGMVNSLIGANTNTSTSEVMSTPGDSNLTTMAGIQTYDGCVIEFDCIPTGDTLEFNFAFGSEEYPEYVGSSFNDVFAILLSGPGISGAVNVAALPVVGVPVSVNNVNATTNATYFYDNENPAGQFISMDGFTINLTAFSVVVPNANYHFKIAIADAGDAVLNSGVFLEAFSFRSNGGGSSNIICTDGKPSIKIFPNPAEDHFTISSPTPLTHVRILNLTGELVKEFSTSEKFLQLSTENFSAGIYFVETVTAEKVEVSKLVVR